MANTLGLMTHSFINSLGQSAISGRDVLDINFGLGSYNFKSGKVDWTFDNENNFGGYINSFSDVINVFNLANDIYALGFSDFRNYDADETQAGDLAKNKYNADVIKGDPFEVENTRDWFDDNWIKVGEKLDYYYDAMRIHDSRPRPPLGEWLNGVGRRIKKAHFGIFNNQSYLHYDLFDINKNFLFQVAEWLSSNPTPKLP